MDEILIHVAQEMESRRKHKAKPTWLGELKTVLFWKECFSEYVGTTIFFFGGFASIVGAVAVDPALTNSSVILISLGFGLSAMTTLMWVSHISSHINPVVTLAFAILREVSPIKAMMFFLCQMIGGLTSAGILKLLTFEAYQNISTVNELPKGMSPGQGVLCEVIMTFILVSMIIGTVDRRKVSFAGQGLEIGLTVSFCVFAAFRFSGPGMNPARSFGPAVVFWQWKDHWIFWVGPVIGSSLAALTYRYLLCPYGKKIDNRDALKDLDQLINDYSQRFSTFSEKHTHCSNNEDIHLSPLLT